MKEYFPMWKKTKNSPSETIAVRDERGIRSLYLGGNRTIQSSMRINQPLRLELGYTRAMMAFLLFANKPKYICLIGLGGGSIAKFLHSHFPTTLLSVYEIHSQVIDVAHSQFFLPLNSDFIDVECADGIDKIETQNIAADILMVDAFDGSGLAERFLEPSFLIASRKTIGEEGIFCINLWRSHADFNRHVHLLSEAFEGHLLLLPVREKGNVIAFGFNTPFFPTHWKLLTVQASALTQWYSLEFDSFLADLRLMNMHNDTQLLL